MYNWGEYISNGVEGSMDVNAEFTRRTGIGVNYTTYDTNEAMYAKLASGGGDYDIIVPSDYMVSRMIEEDMLAELDFSNIPISSTSTKRSATRPMTRKTGTRCRTPGGWWGCFITPIMLPKKKPSPGRAVGRKVCGQNFDVR